MFNLDQAIAEWRRQMVAAGIKTPEVLDELEGHLREDVEEQVRSGSNAQEAFEAAVQRMGQANSLKVEFEKAGEMAGQEKKFWSRGSTMAVGFLSGFFCLGLSAYGLLKHELDMWQRVLGFSALASMILLGLGSYFLSRLFLNTADPRTKKSVTFGGAALWIGWMLCFFFVILPRCELEMAGLVVALTWAFAPGAVAGGAGLALEEGSSRQPAEQ
jgi:hypothetical protein